MNLRIKQIRKHFALTQSEFGSKLGVTQASVAGWESGIRNPQDPALTLICKTFGINETWLRTGEGEMFLPEDRENALMAWVGEVLAEESESFRRRYLQALMTLTPQDWERAEQFMRRLIDQPPDS